MAIAVSSAALWLLGTGLSMNPAQVCAALGVVSLIGTGVICAVIPEAPIRRIEWRHFLYDNAAALRVPHFAELQGKRRTWYCGEYAAGPGHEAALVSGLLAATMIPR